jgi:hypothetical protein
MVTVTVTPQPTPPSKGKRLLGAATAAYVHVAAVLGAVGLASMAAGLGTDWRGVLAYVIGIWATVIRPVGRAIVTVVTLPFNWFLDWHVEVPNIVSDYVSIGVVLVFAMARAGRTIPRFVPREGKEPFGHPALKRRHLLLGVVIWPVMLPYLVLATIDVQRVFSDLDDRGIPLVRPATPGRESEGYVLFLDDIREIIAMQRRYLVLSVLPLAYLAMLFILNLMLS